MWLPWLSVHMTAALMRTNPDCCQRPRSSLAGLREDVHQDEHWGELPQTDAGQQTPLESRHASLVQVNASAERLLGHAHGPAAVADAPAKGDEVRR